MVLISEADLPYLPIDDPGFQSDPFAYIDAAREQHPWLARIDVGYFVFGYEAVKELAARDDLFHPDFRRWSISSASAALPGQIIRRTCSSASREIGIGASA